MTWNGNANRRMRRLQRWFKEAWSKGLIVAMLIAIVAILIAWANVTGR